MSRPAETILESAEIERLDVIKIDVEGHQCQVMSSLKPAIQRLRARAIVIEHDGDMRDTKDPIRNLFDELGYQVSGIAKRLNGWTAIPVENATGMEFNDGTIAADPISTPDPMGSAAIRQRESMQRRDFLNLAAAGMATASIAETDSIVLARDPVQRFGQPRFRLGLAAYSFRDYFSFMKGKERKPRSDGDPMRMIKLLDYCVEHDVEAAELTSYFFPPTADAAYFREIKRQAFLRGVTISGTAIGNNFTVGKGDRLEAEIQSAIKWIDHASEMGAPHIRIFAGTGRDIQEDPSRIDQAIEAVGVCAEHAAKRGVFLGVENHGNLTSDQMLEIMQKVNSPWVGMNLDTGNFFSDDPYVDLEKCVGYALNVQVKLMMQTADRKRYPADLGRVAKILKAGNYQGFVVLEYEEKHPYEEIPESLDKLKAALAGV